MPIRAEKNRNSRSGLSRLQATPRNTSSLMNGPQSQHHQPAWYGYFLKTVVSANGSFNKVASLKSTNAKKSVVSIPHAGRLLPSPKQLSSSGNIQLVEA